MGKPETADPEAIFEFHTKLIEKLLEYDDVVAALSGKKEDIGIYITEPDTRLRLVIDGTDTHLVQIDPSDGDVDDPRITMKWMSALKFWHGDLDIMGALLTGVVKVEGQNMDPLFRLKSVVHRAKKASTDTASEMGWG